MYEMIIVSLFVIGCISYWYDVGIVDDIIMVRSELLTYGSINCVVVLRASLCCLLAYAEMVVWNVWKW